MTTLLRRLFRYQLARALECRCPSRVPRSGEAGARVNCLSVYVDRATEPYLLVQGLSGSEIECLEWTGSSFDKPVTVELASVPLGDVTVTHFYGYSEVAYRGASAFVLGRTLRLPYLKLRAIRVVESIDQYFFNKKKLVTKQRIDLLRLLVARRLDGHNAESPIDLMTSLYSIKCVQHPEKETQQERVRFYLDSLVDTGELAKVDHRYVMTGKALQAIEVYEEQERKHTESIKAQRAMFWLTMAIALLTAAQAGLIKFSTLLDLSVK